MKKIVRLIVLLQILMTFPVFAEEKSSFFVLPAVIRLEGVGMAYGIAGGVKNATPYHLDVIFGKSWGEIQGQGLLTNLQPSGKEGSRYSIGYMDINSARIKTTYQRGISEDDPFLQELSGTFSFIGVESPKFDDWFQLGLLLGQSKVRILQYLTTNETKIELKNANLHDVTTTFISPNFKIDFTEKKDNGLSGFLADYRVTLQTGRIGLSDTLIQRFGSAYHLPLSSRFFWVNRFGKSDASVISKKDQYGTTSEVRLALQGDCTSNIDPGIQQRCEDLKTALIEQIVAENNLGTAQPLGGAYSLRGYRESRFKARHTARFASELHYGNKTFRGVLFTEAGYASDDSEILYKKSVRSNGLAFHLTLGEIPLRLGAAKGKEGNLWYFALGQYF